MIGFIFECYPHNINPPRLNCLYMFFETHIKAFLFLVSCIHVLQEEKQIQR